MPCPTSLVWSTCQVRPFCRRLWGTRCRYYWSAWPWAKRRRRRRWKPWPRQWVSPYRPFAWHMCLMCSSMRFCSRRMCVMRVCRCSCRCSARNPSRYRVCSGAAYTTCSDGWWNTWARVRIMCVRTRLSASCMRRWRRVPSGAAWT